MDGYGKLPMAGGKTKKNTQKGDAFAPQGPKRSILGLFSTCFLQEPFFDPFDPAPSQIDAEKNQTPFGENRVSLRPI